MAAALEDTPVRYEDLAELEKDFDDVETEIIRQQVKLTYALYVRRQKTVSQIPNFWPLVLEQAPPEIDQYIQPSDSALLLSSLQSLSVSHFHILPQDHDSPLVADDTESIGEDADPRSFSIRFEFADNEHFEDRVIEKKFWHRRAMDGWQGLVSEPVNIRWKKGKDLTGGILNMVCKAWNIEHPTSISTDTKSSLDKGKELSDSQKILKKKIESTSVSGLSFFAWFGFIGRRVSAEESIESNRKENARRERWRSGEKVDVLLEEDDEEDVDLSLEIFPDGDELAVAFKEDLWVDAIKYFTQAQEQDALSDADFESDEEEDGGDEEANDGDEERPSKRQRS